MSWLSRRRLLYSPISICAPPSLIPPKSRFSYRSYAASHVEQGIDIPVNLRQASMEYLLRSYFVYSALSVPSFVDASPHLLQIATSIPVVRYAVLSAARETLFKHFVGGDTFEASLALVQDLRRRNLGCLIGYSVEVKENGTQGVQNVSEQALSNTIPYYKNNVQEILRSILLAAHLEDGRNSRHAASRKTWIAIKLTALLFSVKSLENSSSTLHHEKEANAPSGMELLYNPPVDSPMAEMDIQDLKSLHSSLREIVNLACYHQMRIAIDAEHSWYQPAMDALMTGLMRRYNTKALALSMNSIIYFAYQAYRLDTPDRLRHALDHATTANYGLGVKLVRGTYHLHELEHYERYAINKGSLPPVWVRKIESDQRYNHCIGFLLDRIAAPNSSIGVLFGTHNKDSCDAIFDGLVQRRPATVVSEDCKPHVLVVPRETSLRVEIGQLLGMADALTNYISCRLECPGVPMVLKYVLYGALDKVMPYLARRAVENKSVVGNTNTKIERQRIFEELRRRLLNRAEG